MCQGELVKKDEDQGWDLYEALADKIIQWESYPERTNPQLLEPECTPLSSLKLRRLKSHN